MPIVQVPGDNVRVKPLFLDVELEDAKHWEVSRWSQLAVSLIMVDRSYIRELIAYSSPLLSDL